MSYSTTKKSRRLSNGRKRVLLQSGLVGAGKEEQQQVHRWEKCKYKLTIIITTFKEGECRFLLNNYLKYIRELKTGQTHLEIGVKSQEFISYLILKIWKVLLTNKKPFCPFERIDKFQENTKVLHRHFRWATLPTAPKALAQKSSIWFTGNKFKGRIKTELPGSEHWLVPSLPICISLPSLTPHQKL